MSPHKESRGKENKRNPADKSRDCFKVYLDTQCLAEVRP